MKKRFFTFLMAVWALLSISQTVKADDDVYLMTVQNINGTPGSYNIPSNHKMDLESGDTYKIKIESNSDGEFCFRVGVNSSPQYQLAPSTDQEPLSITEERASISAKSAFKKGEDAWKVSFNKDTYEYITIHVVIRGETKVWVDGKKKDSGTVTSPTPSDENPIANRKYSEGYYLVGNFFNFDGDNINYKDAVFKFQQQNDDEKGNAVYMVEIPATLTAKAQVMSVDATGTPVAVYGPGSVLAIDNSTLSVGADNQTATTGIKDLKSSTKIEDDGTNRWDMTTRRTKYDGVGQDGSYKYYIAVDKTTGKPSKWEIKYTDLKRVAYLLSTNPLGSALTVGSTRVQNTFESGNENEKMKANFNSGKYFGSLYMDKDGEYYGISNDVRGNDGVNGNYIYGGYGAIVNEIDRPTYNKLFLLGNGGLDITQDQNTKVAANWGAFKSSTESGVYVLEFNTNKGNYEIEKDHGGVGAEIQKKNAREVITSLSMVGPAIPGTTTGNEWDWPSTVADMDFDVSENCYKLTIATTEENKNQVFRFVGNHTQEINWFENSNDDQTEKAAKYNDDGTYGIGHKASPSDPNEISYTESGLTVNSGEDYHINWNRPAGTWTVRFYIYTYSQNGNNPSFRYFYTISENRDLELRDFEDVVYKSETRNILKRGGYRYFRTWSDNKAWKRPENVDVFVVSQTPAETSNGGFVLTKINSFNSSEDVIPANTGVILALRKDLEVPGAVFHTRKSLITYNTLVIPLEEATNKDLKYTGGNNRLLPLIEAQVVPTKEGDKYNYLFGFYRANKVSKKTYNDNDFLLGFWISNGTGAFYSNSAYLPIDEATAAKMKLGVSYNDFDSTTGAKKVPGVIFDFANVGGTTGINEVVNQSTKLNDGKYYTLSGQQVEKPTAGGIYIHNGRKFVVK